MVIYMSLKRDEYLQRLIVRRHNGFIKVITGIRRRGKSYLLNTLFCNYLISENVDIDHIIKFAFDSAEDFLKIGEDPIVLDNEKNDRKVDPKKFLTWILPPQKQYGRIRYGQQFQVSFERHFNGI